MGEHGKISRDRGLPSSSSSSVVLLLSESLFTLAGGSSSSCPLPLDISVLNAKSRLTTRLKERRRRCIINLRKSSSNKSSPAIDLFRILIFLLTHFSSPDKSGGFSLLGTQIFTSESMPLVAKNGNSGWHSRTLTAPFSSPRIHCTIFVVFLSQKNILPQSLPLTINSEPEPKKLTPLIV